MAPSAAHSNGPWVNTGMELSEPGLDWEVMAPMLLNYCPWSC